MMKNLTQEYPLQLRKLESSLLPNDDGTVWAKSFYEDFVPRATVPLGPGSGYPEWLDGSMMFSCAAKPFFFHGVYNGGDCPNFNTLIAAILSPDFAVETQRVFPSIIRQFGFMPGVLNPPHYAQAEVVSRDYSATTWGPCCYWDHYAWMGDLNYLDWFSDSCATWARWWLENRDRNGDGWLEPGVNGCVPAEEEFRRRCARENPEIAKNCPDFWDYVGEHNPKDSAMHMMICEAPWDDGPVYLRGRCRGLRFDPVTQSGTVHFIETQLYISMLCRFVADAFTRLGRDDARFFAENAQRLADLVREHCWDEESGFYYDRDIETGTRRTFVKHLGAFVPMLMGLPTVEQAGRMVERLTNPEEFWTDYPVPTISKDSPDYHPTHYWSGRAWPSTNFFVLRALLNYGYFDVADEYLRRWMKHIQSCVDRTPDIEGVDAGPDARRMIADGVQWIVPENWNPETGEVIGSGGVTWGGLWLPALIMRHFWPLWDGRILLRGGGTFRFAWGSRWNVEIRDQAATVNGNTLHLPSGETCLYDPERQTLRSLPPGQADPCLLEGIAREEKK